MSLFSFLAFDSLHLFVVFCKKATKNGHYVGISYWNSYKKRIEFLFEDLQVCVCARVQKRFTQYKKWWLFFFSERNPLLGFLFFFKGFVFDLNCIDCCTCVCLVCSCCIKLVFCMFLSHFFFLQNKTSGCC